MRGADQITITWALTNLHPTISDQLRRRLDGLHVEASTPDDLKANLIAALDRVYAEWQQAELDHEESRIGITD